MLFNYTGMVANIMREKIQSALDELTSRYDDERFCVCDISIQSLDGNKVSLGGRILDADTLDQAKALILSRTSDVELDVEAVTVLGQDESSLLTVGTNLTSVHSKPSFGAEQLSQMIYGDAVEVLETSDKWAFVRQYDGYLGWTYLPYLREQPASHPTHLILSPTIALHDAPLRASEVVGRVMSGTGVRLEMVEGEWSQVMAHQIGWLPSSILRDVRDFPQTPEERRALIASDCIRMIGTPYLWGGISGNGIDCSGYARLLHKWIGIDIPRDADLQARHGAPAQPPYQVGDLLFFGDPDSKRRITHVAVSLGGWKIVHSSRRRNGVAYDDLLEVESLMDNFVCAVSYINA